MSKTAITARTIHRVLILLFTESKEMPSKTRKHSRRHRRRTLKHRKQKKGGADSQSLIPPTPGFKVSVPDPANKIV
jgi:hypothetical protein